MVGLDMHKAPNAVERRKHESHSCPPEKADVIKTTVFHRISKSPRAKSSSSSAPSR